MINMTFKRTKL